ncbi:hypothetical protein B5X24_HaOG205015 [Helicoverpa armigera]|nr:hypothetical protein B5X24_HaOG205015 [Helicoverpa armigera]
MEEVGTKGPTRCETRLRPSSIILSSSNDFATMSSANRRVMDVVYGTIASSETGFFGRLEVIKPVFKTVRDNP